MPSFVIYFKYAIIYLKIRNWVVNIDVENLYVDVAGIGTVHFISDNINADAETLHGAGNIMYKYKT